MNVHEKHRSRLRDRYEREGAWSLEEHEMLELFLFGIIPRNNTNPIAHELLSRFGSLFGVFTAPKGELVKVHGVGEKTADYIIASYEEYCADIERMFKQKSVQSDAFLSNCIMWYTSHFRAKLGLDSFTFAVFFDCKRRILDVSSLEVPDICLLKQKCCEIGAPEVIVCAVGGADAGSLPSLLIEDGVTLSVIKADISGRIS